MAASAVYHSRFENAQPDRTELTEAGSKLIRNSIRFLRSTFVAHKKKKKKKKRKKKRKKMKKQLVEPES